MTKLDINIDDEFGLIRVTPAQAITVEDACAAIKDIIDTPGFEKGLPSIWDLRHTELMHINADDIKVISEVANSFKEQRGAARIARCVGRATGLGCRQYPCG